jgi:hypothetical protein
MGGDVRGGVVSELGRLLAEAYNAPDPNHYLFQVGQVARLRKGRSNDGQTPACWDGAVVGVMGRYCTGLHKEHWYKVRHMGNGATGEFAEDEFDARYARRPRPGKGG